MHIRIWEGKGADRRSEQAIQRLKQIMVCTTQAMMYIHSQDIQHRNSKPANILLKPGEIILTDFGIARDRADVERTTTDYYAGRFWGYAAPEVTAQDWTNAREADIYSLGCVFLHIVTVIYRAKDARQ